MAIRVRPKQVGLKLRSGDFIRPGEEATLQIDEAWELYTLGLVEIVDDKKETRIEMAVTGPRETR